MKKKRLKNSPNNIHCAIGQTIKLRPRNSLEVGNASTAGKINAFLCHCHGHYPTVVPDAECKSFL